MGAKPEVESEIEKILNKTQINADREETLTKVLEYLQVPDGLVKKIVDPAVPIDQ